MAVTVHIDQSAINRAFADLAPSAALHKTAIRTAGVALSLMIQQTLRQQGKDYYDAAADATSMDETAEGVSVSIALSLIHILSMHATKPDAAPLRGKCSSGTRLSTRTDFWACSTPG